MPDVDIIIAVAKSLLTVDKCKRDDVYHMIVRMSARYGFNRYEVWQAVVGT